MNKKIKDLIQYIQSIEDLKFNMLLDLDMPYIYVECFKEYIKEMTDELCGLTIGRECIMNNERILVDNIYFSSSYCCVCYKFKDTSTVNVTSFIEGITFLD